MDRLVRLQSPSLFSLSMVLRTKVGGTLKRRIQALLQDQEVLAAGRMDTFFTWVLHLQAAINCASREAAPAATDRLGALHRWPPNEVVVKSGTSAGGKVADQERGRSLLFL